MGLLEMDGKKGKKKKEKDPKIKEICFILSDSFGHAAS
jgi:hypothetical protein